MLSYISVFLYLTAFQYQTFRFILYINKGCANICDIE